MGNQWLQGYFLIRNQSDKRFQISAFRPTNVPDRVIFSLLFVCRVVSSWPIRPGNINLQFLFIIYFLGISNPTAQPQQLFLDLVNDPASSNRIIRRRVCTNQNSIKSDSIGKIFCCCFCNLPFDCFNPHLLCQGDFGWIISIPNTEQAAALAIPTIQQPQQTQSNDCQPDRPIEVVPAEIPAKRWRPGW